MDPQLAESQQQLAIGEQPPAEQTQAEKEEEEAKEKPATTELDTTPDNAAADAKAEGARKQAGGQVTLTTIIHCIWLICTISKCKI